jgi:hypothetical protein
MTSYTFCLLSRFFAANQIVREWGSSRACVLTFSGDRLELHALEVPHVINVFT